MYLTTLLGVSMIFLFRDTLKPLRGSPQCSVKHVHRDVNVTSGTGHALKSQTGFLPQ